MGILPLFFIVSLISITLYAAAFQVFFSEKAVIKRRLKQIPSRQISMIKNDEIVKITGKVRCLEKPLIAPLSGRPCAYYYVFIEEVKDKKRQTLIEDEEEVKFVIDNENQTAVLDSKKLKSYVVKDLEFSSCSFNDAPPRIEAYLKKHGHKSTDFWGFNKTMYYAEAILEVGEPIAVLGKAKWEKGNQVNTLNAEGEILKITAFGEETVYLSDDPDTLKFYS